MGLKLNNEIIDGRLINRNIKRIGNYINSKVNIEWSCLKCNSVWEASPCDILGGTGCPACAGTLKLTNKIVDQRIFKFKLLRIGNYINNNTKIEWQCLIEDCNHIWEATPKNILYNKTGCPKCSSFKNEKLINNLLLENNINFYYHFNIKKLNLNYPKYYVDFYLPDTNTIIEYNGIQHYEPVIFGNYSYNQAVCCFNKQIERDINLRKICKDNINLIEIDGRDFKNIKLEKLILKIIRK